MVWNSGVNMTRLWASLLADITKPLLSSLLYASYSMTEHECDFIRPAKSNVFSSSTTSATESAWPATKVS